MSEEFHELFACWVIFHDFFVVCRYFLLKIGGGGGGGGGRGWGGGGGVVGILLGACPLIFLSKVRVLKFHKCLALSVRLKKLGFLKFHKCPRFCRA